MTKASVRTEYKRRRLALSAAERGRLEACILAQFQAQTWPRVSYVHAYLPMPAQNEIDPGPFVHWLALQFPQLRVVRPLVVGPGRMEHLDAGERVHPERIDFVFTPLIAFDTHGLRVGYGRGYYDRFLAECRPDVIKVGLSFFDALPPIDDPGEFDIPLSIGISPSKFYAFQ